MRELPLILQLNVSGEPMAWINHEDAAYYYAKELVAWSIGSEDHTLWGGNSRLTGERSFLNLNTIIAVKNEKEMKHDVLHRVPNLTNQSLFRRDMHVCAYCGGLFGKENLSRDHVTPRSRGGKDNWTNVVTACGTCNKLKDNLTPEEAHMPLLYVPYAPNRAEWLILQNRRILADQMEFLLARVPKQSRLLNPVKLS